MGLRKRGAAATPCCTHIPRRTRSGAMRSFLYVIDIAIELYIWVIIISAILSWLVAFNVVNPYNRLVAILIDTTDRLTEPALRPIRRILPNLGGIDISPVILILVLIFVRSLLFELFGPLAVRY